MPNVGDTVGRFVLLQALGRGPLSEVHLGIEEASGWKVAIKFFLIEPGSAPDDRPRWAERMQREARAAASFRHENVVTVHEIGARDDVPYLVRDFIEGRSLAEVVSDCSTAMTEWKLHWLRELARTLAEMHRAQLVHRDVKPGNFLVRRDGAIRVLDFGVARRSIDRTAGLGGAIHARLPSVRDVSRPKMIGTPAYTAPERFGNQPATPSTDQFGWGVMAWELLAGRLPWGDRDAPVKMIDAILTQPVPPLHNPDVRPALQPVIARAMGKLPGQRFPSMDDVVGAFDAALR